LGNFFQRDGVAHLGGLQFLDAGDDEAHLAGLSISRGRLAGVNTPMLSAL
jgi:hypothetical protein